MELFRFQQGIKVTFIKIFIITICLWVGLNAFSSISLANMLVSSKINMQYYFFSVEKKAFLVKEKKDKTYALWYYTRKRKWQPLHNASAFDGFSKALVNLSSISVDKPNEKITFGSITNDDANGDIKNLLETIENKTVKIGWYFWIGKASFLMKKKTNNEINIWHYTNDRKWQPVYNASAFDGFPKVGKTLDNVSFNPSTNILSIGSIINKNGMIVPPTPW